MKITDDEVTAVKGVMTDIKLKQSINKLTLSSGGFFLQQCL
jgi:hypothetical protein